MAAATALQYRQSVITIDDDDDDDDPIIIDDTDDDLQIIGSGKSHAASA